MRISAFAAILGYSSLALAQTQLLPTCAVSDFIFCPDNPGFKRPMVEALLNSATNLPPHPAIATPRIRTTIPLEHDQKLTSFDHHSNHVSAPISEAAALLT